jgi:hypothetical protein
MPPDIRWRGAIAGAERSIEIRNVAKAAGESDIDDPLMIEASAHQHPARAVEPLVAKEFRKRRACFLEQHLQGARRHTVLRGETSDRKVSIGKMRANVCLDRL